MNRLLLGLIVIAALLIAAGCQTGGPVSSPPANNSPVTPASTPDEFAAVREIFVKDCQVCHGDKGEGGPVKLEDGTRLKVPSLRQGHALRHTDADFVKQIEKGGDGMPAFKEKHKPDQINGLVRFIRREFQGK